MAFVIDFKIESQAKICSLEFFRDILLYLFAKPKQQSKAGARAMCFNKVAVDNFFLVSNEFT